MTTWILVIIFSGPMYGNNAVAHNGFSVPGFQSKSDCVYALSLIAPTGSKAICVRTHYGDKE